MEINNKSIIHDSFLRLINSSNLIKKDFFCNDDCYYKCLNVIEKIKNGTINTSKIDWNSNQNNLISQIVTYYYNLGLSQNTNSNNIV